MVYKNNFKRFFLLEYGYCLDIILYWFTTIIQKLGNNGQIGSANNMLKTGVLRKMRKVFYSVLVLVVVSLLTLSGCSSSSGGSASAGSGGSSKDTIKVGMMASLSGKDAQSGTTKKRAAKMAVKEINKNGGVMGKNLKLVIVDKHSTQQGAVAAFQKLAAKNGIVAILGSIHSTDNKAYNQYAKEDQIPVLMGGTNPSLTTTLDNKWYFRFRPNDNYASKSMVNFTIKKFGKDSKIGIVYTNDTFGTGGKKLLSNLYKKKGVEVVDTEGINPGTKDFTPILQKLKDSGVTVLNTYITSSVDVGQLMKQLRAKGFQFKGIVGSASLVSQTTLDVTGKKALNGVYGVNDFALDQSKATKAFVKKYNKKYGKNPDIFAGWVYDALHILDKAIEKENSTDPKAIRKGILSIHDYIGVEGKYDFDKNGDGLHAYSIVSFTNGHIETVKSSTK
ncbi:MAG TPA: ABC transporter substrate-binding protein [Bacillales bacterium]|nr:ABC transporter substrate-binding protein [Bacillales bacterium]